MTMKEEGEERERERRRTDATKRRLSIREAEKRESEREIYKAGTSLKPRQSKTKLYQLE